MRRSIWKNCDGGVFIIVALAALAILGSAGLAIDIGRSQMVQAKLQNSVDAAGLAAGATLNAADLTGIVTKYINLNFNQGNLGATLGEVHTELSEDGKTFTVTASATLPTTIMGIFDEHSVTVDATTEVTRSNKGLEVALVLDTTGSMAGEKLVALQGAAHDLVDILFGEEETGENLWISIVPFSHTVNIGSSRTNWLNAANFGALDWYTTSWSGCVEARYSSGRDMTDDPPYDIADPGAATPAAPYERLNAYYAQLAAIWSTSGSSSVDVEICSNSTSCTCANYGPCSIWTANSNSTAQRVTCSGSGSDRDCTRRTRTYPVNGSTGLNAYCPSAITPLTNVRDTIEAGIDALVARGGTYINFGAVWGWRAISPRWRDYWGGVADDNDLPLDYGAALMSKAVIIMTDGTNSPTGSYSAYASSTDADTRAELDAKTTAVCTSMKAQGIIVYTILFMEDDEGVKTLLSNCATTPDHFFDSPTAESLNAAFTTIGDSLANLRISR